MGGSRTRTRCAKSLFSGEASLFGFTHKQVSNGIEKFKKGFDTVACAVVSPSNNKQE